MIWDWAAAALDALLAARRISGRLLRCRGMLWAALPGDLMGWLVMRGSGIRFAAREADASDVHAFLVEDPRIARYFSLHLIPVQAQTLGRYVFARGPIPAETLAHEMEHVRQWRRFGPFYLPVYFTASAAAFVRGGKPYFDNAFEKAARDRARRDISAGLPARATNRPVR